MRKLVIGAVTALACLSMSGCTQETGPDPTLPPVAPSHRISGSVLPWQVDGYTALGATPAPQQTTVTYARDSQPLDLAVVTFDPTGDLGGTSLAGQQWYGASRCGVLWKSGDAKATPRPTQSACVTVLTDGVMTTVSGGQQTPEDLSGLANAIYQLLAS